MALFSLDIERYYQAQVEEGFELKSIAYIQYPIYCIHATILDSTPDPLEKLDKAIVKCVLVDGTISPLEIAQLLSVQKKTVELRLLAMHNEGLIKGKQNLSVTEEGIEVIIEGKQKRMQKRSYDFYLDGIDFAPLKQELYSSKYINSYYNENEYTYYTNKKGETVSSKPFRPNIVHEPLAKDRIIEKIFDIPENERCLYSIPVGLEEIESIDFTKMSIPILVGLMVKDNKPYRKIINGFSAMGDTEKIISFENKIRDKINNLELRLDTWVDKNTEEQKFTFASNWSEIDNLSEQQKLQFISKEDLKLAFGKFYNIKSLSDDNIISTDYEIGINVSKELFLDIKSNRNQFIKHIQRGRDYQMFSTNNGIWLVFILFYTNCPFVKQLLEIYDFLKTARSKHLGLSHIQERLSQYEISRQALVLLEEKELLEMIDIKENMYVVAHE